MNRSAHLGLLVPTQADQFKTADLVSNWQLLDQYPGTYICTSVSRPTGWGAAQIGMAIYETDTKLTWRWNGTVFERTGGPKGWLGGNSIAADFSTSSTTPAVAISQGIAVPAGDRNVKVTFTCNRIDSGGGRTEVSLWRDGVSLQTFEKEGLVGGTAATAGEGHTLVAWDKPNPIGGSFTYAVKIAALAAYPGTCFVRAAAGKLARLDVEET